jgi:hypothetical protein
MACLWWAETIGTGNVIFRNLYHYGIGNRRHVTNFSNARDIQHRGLALLIDPYPAMTLRLMIALRLRREISTRIWSGWAGRGIVRALSNASARGDRAREVHVRNAGRRQQLGWSNPLVAMSCLIPADQGLGEAVAPLQTPVCLRRYPPDARNPAPVRSGAIS